MTKQKKSFFEKLTGIQKIDDENEIEINDTSEPKEEIISEDDSYSFSEKEKSSEDFFKEPSEEFKSPEPKKEVEEQVFKNETNATHSPVDHEASPKTEENQAEDTEIEAEGQLKIGRAHV